MQPLLNILHLEENTNDVELVQTTLNGLHIVRNFVWVKTAAEFETTLQERPFDLLLADQQLAETDEFAVLKVAQQLRPQTPILVISNQYDDKTALKFIKQGATDFLLKHHLGPGVPGIQRALQIARQRQQMQGLGWAEKDIVFQQLMQLLSHGVIFHSEKEIIYLNPAGVKLLGASQASELLGKSIFDFITAKQRESLQNSLQGVEQTGQSLQQIELQLLRLDGQMMETRLSATVVPTYEPRLVLLVLNDITQQKKAETALRISRNELEMQVEQRTLELSMVKVDLTNERSRRERAESVIAGHNHNITHIQYPPATGASGVNLNRILNNITNEVVNLLNAKQVTVYEWQSTNNSIIPLSRNRVGKLLSKKLMKQSYNLAAYPVHQKVLNHRITEQRQFHTLKTVDVPGTPEHDSAESSPKMHLILPIVVQDEVMGLIEIIDEQASREFTRQEISLAQLMANQAGYAINNARLYQIARSRYREAEALRRAALSISSSIELEQVFEHILTELQHVVPYDSASLQLLKEDGMEIITGRGFPNLYELLGVTYHVTGHTPNAAVIESRQPIIIKDVQQEHQIFFYKGPQAKAQTRSWLGVPLLIGERVIGMLALDKKEPSFYTKSHAKTASAYAPQAALAVENARLYAQAQQEIRERKRAEAALREERASLARRVAERTAALSVANAQLARRSRLKDEFLANMSHEFRTPLNAILGMSESLHEQIFGPLNTRQLHALTRITESGHHLLMLINDILDISKIEAGKLALTMLPTSVQEIAQSSLQMIKQTAQEKKIEVVPLFDTNLTRIPADGRRLRQILVNLLSNAVKFTAEGGKVGLEISHDSSRKVVQMAVWDTGIGIAADDMQHLFKPFIQLDSKLSRQHPGTGLGLSLVSRLTELHGGSIALRSEPGEGSHFTVFLPSESTEVDLEQVQPLYPAENAPRLLLALNNEQKLQNLSAYLEKQGYEIAVAHTGVEILDRVAEAPPALVITTLQLPEMDTLEAIQRLRAIGAQMPIIVLTTVDLPYAQTHCFNAGANEYLRFPIFAPELNELIQAYLQAN